MRKSLYHFFTMPKIKRNIQLVGAYLERNSPWLYDHVFLTMKATVKSYIFKSGIFSNYIDGGKEKLEWEFSYSVNHASNELVSVIVPNYNHAPYLKERLDSIYRQNYKNIEVILLDDCSNDGSIKILKDYKEKYPAITSLYINEVNSKSVFKQWKKGFKLAKGKYIWIAESDDYCMDNFLTSLVPAFEDEAVMLAFARTEFVQDKKRIFSTEEYLKDISVFNWEKDFSVTANILVGKAFSLKNIIPNVSSVVFRNIGSVSQSLDQLWNDMQLCGDWAFYLDIIKGGVVYYSCKTTNYYRIHESSTSLKVQKTLNYYKEHEKIALYIAENYDVPFANYKKILAQLEAHYITVGMGESREKVSEWFSLSKIGDKINYRKPNILMCGFSMAMGGGETFPIVLANELKELEIPVTFVDFQLAENNENVRKMLHVSVPLVKFKKIKYWSTFIDQLGGKVMHTHHGSVDEIVSELTKVGSCKHVISLHGMYEAIKEDDLLRLLPKVKKSCSQFVYTADKNLDSFKRTNIIDISTFQKLDNGLALCEINAMKREDIGIGEKSFVLCLVSRGIPDKGWEEGIAAVELARNISKKNIDLIIIGDGEEYNRLKRDSPTFVHFLGSKANIRDYFAISDVGFLPSKFKGESYPLVIIDSLLSGRPVIASDLGEIRHQIETEKGELAGCLFALQNWEIPISQLANIIANMATDNNLYKNLKKNTFSAAKKFDIEEVAKKYIQIYVDVSKEKVMK
jgi:glycosyltransferase involved in cell wall biosynthesis